ncbi:MAG: hypothetical protein QOI11_2134 [Candidatus Eremiobacteraeota bacterium]|jgi:hypothetical protein|nr:hypothetical protein [Candidatus Eremiobacteraeota bacterium]
MALQRPLAALAAALLLSGAGLAAPPAARADWVPLNYTFCSREYTVDNLEYVAQPVMAVYVMSLSGDGQSTVLTPAQIGVDYLTDPDQWITRPDLGVTRASINFAAGHDFFTVMQFTPFIFDVKTITGPGIKTLDYAPSFPLIQRVRLRVVKANDDPVAAGTEVLVSGWSPDIDPYAAVTGADGQILTFNAAGEQYTGIACLARVQNGQFGKKYPPIGNPFYIEVPERSVEGVKQGSFCGIVQIPETGQTYTVKLAPDACGGG